MGKLILKEFKETAKYFLPVWGACVFAYFLSRFSVTSGLHMKSDFAVDFTGIFVFLMFIIVPFLIVRQFYNSFFSENDSEKTYNIKNCTKIIITKNITATVWCIFVPFAIYNIYAPTIVDNMIKNPSYFDDIDYYLFNPFPGGFKVELIDFYILEGFVNAVECFFLIAIIILVFYISICFARMFSKYNEKIMIALFIGVSSILVLYGTIYVSDLMLFLRKCFENFSELYYGIYASCIGIPIQIIIYIILLFVCKKLLEKALIESDTNK